MNLSLSRDTHGLPCAGWVVYWDEDCSDEEVRKLSFVAWHEETQTAGVMDHLPYQWPTQSAIMAYIALGFPKRKGASPWTNDTIVAELLNVTGSIRVENLKAHGA